MLLSANSIPFDSTVRLAHAVNCAVGVEIFSEEKFTHALSVETTRENALREIRENYFPSPFSRGLTQRPLHSHSTFIVTPGLTAVDLGTGIAAEVHCSMHFGRQ